MNRERLTKLADFLEKEVPDDKFNIWTWGNPACGTAGCAIGWATTIPEFQQAGLKLDGLSLPLFDGWANWNAVEKFFELDWEPAEFLFYAERYQHSPVTATDVATRIRYLLSLEGKANEPPQDDPNAREASLEARWYASLA